MVQSIANKYINNIKVQDFEIITLKKKANKELTLLNIKLAISLLCLCKCFVV